MKLAATWSLLAAGAIGLWWLGGASEPRDPARTVAVEALIPPGATRFVPAAGSPEPVAALTLSIGRDKSYFYARSKGTWRCVDAGGALCEEPVLLGLFEALAAARGLPEGDARDLDLGALGLAPATVLRLDLHGRDVLKPEAQKDVLASIDLGVPRPGLGGPARLSGQERILGLSKDLVPLLGFQGPRRELPPLVSSRALPAPWPGWSAGIARVFVDPKSGESFEVLPLEQDPEHPVAPGLARFELRRAGQPPIEASPILATGFDLFLTRAPRAAIPSAAELPPPEQRRAALTLTLVSKDGSTLTVAVLEGFGPGRRVLIEDFAGTASLIDPEVARLLGPTPDLLLNAKENPWDAYLR